MLGKRPRQMRRTVSISMLGSGSSLSEIPTPPQYPRDKQKPHLDVPACYTPRQVIVSDNMYASEFGKAQTESAACYAAPVPISHSGSITRERKETEVVGLSIVAALHTDQKNESKDYKERTVPALVCRNKPVYQLNFLPSAQPSLSCQIPRKQMQPQDVQMQEPSSSHRNPSSSSQSDPTYISSPDVHFLEACCYCTCRLSQGRDIYMYRGDKAFCSEQCRDRQILIDERKDKCVLAALRMRLAVQSVDTRRQHHQALVTSTAAG